MTWRTITLTLLALSVGLNLYCIEMTYLHQVTIEEMLETQGRQIADYAALSADIQALRRDIEARTKPHETLECQMQMLVAASRGGWRKAERLIQTGALRCAD